MPGEGLAVLDDVPENLKPPDGMVLKPSSIATNEIGVWCEQPFAVGTRFGPFRGEIVTEYKPGQAIDTYAWEVLDLSTHEFLYYIDSSDQTKSNWMRFVRCANYFEEQNIVSEQDGKEIFYKVIKEINPNEELLTWYDMTQFRKSVRARARIRKAGRKPLKKLKISNNEPVNPPTNITATNCSDQKSENPSSVSKKYETDSDRSPRSRRKPSILDSYVCGEESLPEMDRRKNRLSSTKSNSPKVLSNPNSPKLSESMSKSPRGDDLKVDSDEGNDKHFHFMMTSEHLVQDGRHFLFKCDVCCATYRHAFSLKRHFLRRHVNYACISEHDRLNCGLNGRRYLELQSLVNNDPNLIKTATQTKDANNSNEPQAEPDLKCEETIDSPKDIRYHDDEVNSKMDIVDGEQNTKDNHEDDEDVYRPVVSPISLPESTGSNHELSTSNNSTATGSDVISVAQTINANEEKAAVLNSNKDTLIDAFFESQLAMLNKKLRDLDSQQQERIKPRKDFTNDNQPILKQEMKVFWCEHCNQLHNSLQELKAHFKTAHPFSNDVREKNEWNCAECELKFQSRKEHEKHVKIHEETVDLTCRKCGKNFKTLGRFRKHEQSVKCVGRIRCRMCPADFANRRNFLEHYRRFHQTTPDGVTMDDKNGEDPKPDVNLPIGESSFAVVESDKETDGVESLDRDASMKIANQTHGFRFACTICKKRFKEYHFMCRHRRLAHQSPRRRLGQKKVPKEEAKLETRDEEDPSAFYAGVASNIAENLTYFIDGKYVGLGNGKNTTSVIVPNDQCGSNVATPNWCSMNFSDSCDPRTFHHCVPQIAVDLSLNSGMPKPPRPIVDMIQTRIQPFCSPVIVQRTKQQRLDALNFYQSNSRLRYVCMICAIKFDSMDKLSEHQINLHSAVSNDHIELDVDCTPPVFTQPTTQGILGKLATPDVVYQQDYRCTKCEGKFDKIDDLHSHIVTCGPLLSNETVKPWRPKFRRKFRPYRLADHQRDCKVDKKKARPASSSEGECEAPVAEEPTRRTTRGSLDHSYDPRRHVRRRDTRPVLDTEQCRACLKRFKNLLELERHARICSEKQYFRNSGNHTDVGMKCIYCFKLFTYKLSLKKHLLEICKVKKELSESDQISDEKLEEEGLLLQVIEDNLPLVPIKGKVNNAVLRKKKKKRRIRLGLKPSFKKVFEMRMKKKRKIAFTEEVKVVNENSMVSTESEKSEEPVVSCQEKTVPEVEIVAETTTRVAEKAPEQSEQLTTDIGKRSRKMTVKALESVTLQISLDCPERKKPKMTRKPKPLKIENNDLPQIDAKLSADTEIIEAERTKMNTPTPEPRDISLQHKVAVAKSVPESDASSTADSVKSLVKGRKRKLDNSEKGQQKAVISVTPKLVPDNSSVCSDDPYEFTCETVPVSQGIVRFKKNGEIKKKPGRKPKKLLDSKKAEPIPKVIKNDALVYPESLNTENTDSKTINTITLDKKKRDDEILAENPESIKMDTLISNRDKIVSDEKLPNMKEVESDSKNEVIQSDTPKQEVSKSDKNSEVLVKKRKIISEPKARKATLDKGVPLVFSKRVVNLQRKLKRTS